MIVKDRAREDDGEKQELVLTLSASAEEVKKYTDQFFAEIAQRDIPGFRKGKAPRTVLEQNVGGHNAAMGGVAETIINELAFKAIDDADVIFISEPEFNVDTTVEEGMPFTFTVSGEVAPVMRLSSYEPVAIEMPPEEATDAEVQSQILELQDYYHSLVEVTDPEHIAADGDYVSAQLTVTDSDGKVVSGLRNSERLVGLGRGTMPASFDENMIGTKVGDILEFDFDAKKEDGTSDFGDGTLHAAVEVKGFRCRVVPPVDDDLAVKVGCIDVKDMYKQMRYNINQQKSKDLPKLMVDRAVSELVTRLEGDVPEYYVDFIRQDVGRELMQSLQQQGTNLQEWMMNNNISSDQIKEDVSTEAVRRASIDCALEALFVEKSLQITEGDIDKMFEGDDDSQDTREQWESTNRMANLRKMCRQSKASQWLVDTALVTVVEEDAPKEAETAEEA